MKTADNIKHLDISSTYRDRTKYMNPADFVVNISQSGTSSSGMTAKSGISLAIPYESGTVQGSTQTEVTLPTTSSAVTNFYIGSVVELPNDANLTGQFATITAYNATTKVATVTGFSTTPATAGAQFYNIRKVAPIYQGTAQGGSNTNTIIFPATASSVTDFYKGSYIGFTTNATFVPTATLRGTQRLITAYDGSTRTATTLPFPAATATNQFDLDQFTSDSYFPMIYSGTLVSSSQPVCYEMQLVNIILPNQLVGSITSNSPENIGGRLNNYPFVYVEVYSESFRSSDQILYSNNPKTSLVTFKCPVIYNFAPSSAADMPFFVLFDLSPKVLKFKPNDNLHFTVKLPNGEVLKYINNDNAPPQFANPELQINWLISMKRLD